MTCIGIDMETATLFIVGHYNEISRGALLLVTDVPTTPDGVKTSRIGSAGDQYAGRIFISKSASKSMTDIGSRGEQIKHFRY